MVAGSFLIAPFAGLGGPRNLRAGARPKSRRSTEVKSKVDDLHHQAEIVSERMNLIKVEMAGRGEAPLVVADGPRPPTGQRRRTARRRSWARLSVTSRPAADCRPSTSFLVADDPKKFLDDLANSAVAEGQQADMLTELSQLQQQLSVQQEQAQVEVDAIADDKAELADRKAELDEKTADAQAILDDLEAEELERLLAMQASSGGHGGYVGPQPQRPPASAAATSRRPSVRLSPCRRPSRRSATPTSTAPPAQTRSTAPASPCTRGPPPASRFRTPPVPQPGAGTPVSFSQLMPGDLIFYYSPISHVGMYIGNGQIVHAPHPGTSVQVVSMNMMPMTMAVRIG